jgi:hypothetical protein
MSYQPIGVALYRLLSNTHASLLRKVLTRNQKNEEKPGLNPSALEVLKKSCYQGL